MLVVAWISVDVHSNRFETVYKRYAIFTDLSQLIAVSSQTDCM